MKENIKIALLGLIAVTLIINTFMKGDGSSDHDHSNSPVMTTKRPSNNNVISVDEDGILENEPISDQRSKTSVVFETYDYDFGDIQQDTENEKIFTFTNTGQEPLVITNAKGSCGCTVPEYPKYPIEPGESGEIKVVYSPGKQQYKQTKSVTITANTDPETTVLKIYANVIPTGETAEG